VDLVLDGHVDLTDLSLIAGGEVSGFVQFPPSALAAGLAAHPCSCAEGASQQGPAFLEQKVQLALLLLGGLGEFLSKSTGL
jgi:hypothetical protein